ncbi:hypothetical protein [Glutamicibacter sp. NPDC087344]|uniref:hypothetical protein n=1 Tax=Glutamicibacter sp. NPDC087344 TaxID=3363994 RepID=UPI0038023BCA
MSKSVTLDGQILHGRDRYGSWRINSMEGWSETPEPKTNGEPRPSANGDYDAEVYYGPRLVTINGRLIAKTPGDAFMARQHLTSLLRKPGKFSVDQFNQIQHAVARRGRIQPGNIVGRWLTFQMEIRFIGPQKFGEERIFVAKPNESVAAFHQGNHPASPVATVAGSFPGGYTLTLAGLSVVVTEPLTSSAPHTVDFAKGRLYKNGAVVRGGMSTAMLGKVEPFQRDAFSISPNTTGNGTATLSIFDTFM